MSSLIKVDPVDEGFKAMLLTALEGAGTGGTDLLVEIGSAPLGLNKDASGKLIDPYAIVYPITVVGLRGSIANPQRSGDLPYQVTSVGQNRRSARIMSDLVRAAVTDRTANGAFLHPLNAGPDMVVSDRRCSEIGFAEAIVGLWQVPDTYVLAAQAI